MIFITWKEAFCSQNSNCSRWCKRSIVLKAMGVIPVRIKNSGEVTNVYSLSNDSLTALIHHDPSYLGPLILTHHLKGMHFSRLKDQKYLKRLLQRKMHMIFRNLISCFQLPNDRLEMLSYPFKNCKCSLLGTLTIEYKFVPFPS